MGLARQQERRQRERMAPWIDVSPRRVRTAARLQLARPARRVRVAARLQLAQAPARPLAEARVLVRARVLGRARVRRTSASSP